MPPAPPYLEGDVRRRFDRWLETAWGRFCPPLTFAEVRKGVQALSSHYVERRAEPRLAERALAGRGKRAAFATYYAALHFLESWHIARRLGEPLSGTARIHDLGCGTGAAGAGVAAALGAPRVRGVDRSGWALGEARRTYAAFGLGGATHRGRLPGALPARTGAGDLLLLAWTANELEEETREALGQQLWRAAERGAAALVLEPLAGAAVPWWKAWAERAEATGGGSLLWKRALARPALVARMDKAAGLDHAVLGARALWLPGRRSRDEPGGGRRDAPGGSPRHRVGGRGHRDAGGGAARSCAPGPRGEGCPLPAAPRVPLLAPPASSSERSRTAA